MVTDRNLMQALSSDALQEMATIAIEVLRDRGDLYILKKIDGTIPSPCFNDERLDSDGARESLIKVLYDDCDVFSQQHIADYTCDMASQEKLREAIDWREQQEMLRQENESYRMERTLSAPQI